MGGYSRLIMYRLKDTQERIIHRLKIAQGHLKKVVEMVEQDKYCIDVIHQLQAVESGLKETSSVLLENHLTCCVADAMTKGNKNQAIREVMEVFKKVS